jgi:hypothetical protein
VGKQILWIINEEGQVNQSGRLMSTVLGLSEDEIVEHMEGNIDRYKEMVDGKVLLKFQGQCSLRMVRDFCDRYPLAIVIADIADHFRVGGDSNFSEVERLQKLYHGFRTIAQEHNVVFITAGQAPGDLEGKRWLSLKDMNYSRTAKQGCLDVALGIGRDNEDSGQRYIHVVKNKGPTGKVHAYLDRDTGVYT